MRSICTSSRASVRLLGLRGQHVISLHQQIQTLIRTQASDPEAAHLLAEPQVNAAREEIVWFTSLDGDIQRLADIPSPRREAIEGRYHAMLGALQALSDQLQAQAANDPQRQREAELLAMAMRCRDGNCLYAVGDQPVVVNWGTEPADPQGKPVDLMMLAPAGTAAALASAPTTNWGTAAGEAAGGVPTTRPTRGRPLAWGAVGALAVANFLVLACMMGWTLFGWRPAFCGAGCQVAAAPAEEARQLTDDIRLLRQTLQERQAGCTAGNIRVPAAQTTTNQVPEQPSAAPAPTATPASEAQQDAKRVENRGGKRGTLEITLVWNSLDDLDLHVRCPSGENINLGGTACGGQHDVDSNLCSPDDASCDRRKRATAKPVEHVTWAKAPPQGNYEIGVKTHRLRPGRFDRTFRLSVKLDDQVVATQSAVFAQEGSYTYYKLSVPSGTLARK